MAVKLLQHGVAKPIGSAITRAFSLGTHGVVMNRSDCVQSPTQTLPDLAGLWYYVQKVELQGVIRHTLLCFPWRAAQRAVGFCVPGLNHLWETAAHQLGLPRSERGPALSAVPSHPARPMISEYKAVHGVLINRKDCSRCVQRSHNIVSASTGAE